MDGLEEEKYLMAVFTDALYMKARSALVTLEEMKQASLTVDEGDDYTAEERADIVEFVSALFSQPRHGVTVIGHIWTRDYWQVLAGKAELKDLTPGSAVVRGVTDAEYFLTPDAYARADAGVCQAHHTVVFIAGDGR
jgi:hypothetical protein